MRSFCICGGYGISENCPPQLVADLHCSGAEFDSVGVFWTVSVNSLALKEGKTSTTQPSYSCSSGCTTRSYRLFPLELDSIKNKPISNRSPAKELLASRALKTSTISEHRCSKLPWSQDNRRVWLPTLQAAQDSPGYRPKQQPRDQWAQKTSVPHENASSRLCFWSLVLACFIL
jgi:hypothetical protein